MKICMLLMSFLLSLNIIGTVVVQDNSDGIQLMTDYGTTLIGEPVLIELIKSSAFERLKKIRQYGITFYVHPEDEYTRYEHSLGVFFLTRHFGAPLQEQIAALLHDVSHTVFSHIGDHLFNSGYQTKKSSYQDNIHEWYLQESGLADILQAHACQNCCSIKAKKSQPCFDQDLPGLCADRIEYNLHGGLIDGLLTQEDIKHIMSHLHFKDKNWYFDDCAAAKKLAVVSLQLSERRWGGCWNVFVDTCASQALKQALTVGLVTQQDINFGTDDIIWQKLLTSKDEQIVMLLARVYGHEHAYCTCTPDQADMHLKGKFSGVDPLIKSEQGLQCLSILDKEYAQEYERVRGVVTRGYYVRVLPVEVFYEE